MLVRLSAWGSGLWQYGMLYGRVLGAAGLSGCRGRLHAGDFSRQLGEGLVGVRVSKVML